MKQWIDDKNLTLEERFENLRKHYIEETQYLYNALIKANNNIKILKNSDFPTKESLEKIPELSPEQLKNMVPYQVFKIYKYLRENNIEVSEDIKKAFGKTAIMYDGE